MLGLQLFILEDVQNVVEFAEELVSFESLPGVFFHDGLMVPKRTGLGVPGEGVHFLVDLVSEEVLLLLQILVTGVFDGVHDQPQFLRHWPTLQEIHHPAHFGLELRAVLRGVVKEVLFESIDVDFELVLHLLFDDLAFVLVENPLLSLVLLDPLFEVFQIGEDFLVVLQKHFFEPFLMIKLHYTPVWIE